MVASCQIKSRSEKLSTVSHNWTSQWNAVMSPDTMLTRVTLSCVRAASGLIAHRVMICYYDATVCTLLVKRAIIWNRNRQVNSDLYARLDLSICFQSISQKYGMADRFNNAVLVKTGIVEIVEYSYFYDSVLQVFCFAKSV